MSFGVIPGSELFKEAGNGAVFELELRCSFSDVVPVRSSELPWFGDEMPGNPLYHVVDVFARSTDGGACAYKVTYSTEKKVSETAWNEKIKMGAESVDDDAGWTWLYAGTPVIDPMPRQRPLIIHTLTGNELLPPRSKIAPYLYAVNDRKFRGVEAGFLRFDGADADNNYATDRSIISSNSIYVFTERVKKEWKFGWRKALQARDATGGLIYWQNIDESEAFYTADQKLIATPVYMHQVPGQETNIAGKADWDIAVQNDTPYYAECDFATVLGLPRMDGDAEGDA